MKPTVAVLYSDAGAAALIDALKVWRADHAPQAAYESLFTEHIRKVEVTNTLQQGGESEIKVRVWPVGRGRYDQYYFLATLIGGAVKLQRCVD